MSNKETLNVSILGKSYSLLTDEDRHLVEHAAELVETLLKSIAAPTAPPAEMAKKTTFVALKVAVDLLKERQKLESLDSKTATLNDLLKDTLSA